MHRVQISEELYDEALRRAREAGLGSVDDFISNLLKQDFEDDLENLDRFFTPERLAHIDRAAAQVRAGESFTAEEVREHFAQ